MAGERAERDEEESRVVEEEEEEGIEEEEELSATNLEVEIAREAMVEQRHDKRSASSWSHNRDGSLSENKEKEDDDDDDDEEEDNEEREEEETEGDEAFLLALH